MFLKIKIKHDFLKVIACGIITSNISYSLVFLQLESEREFIKHRSRVAYLSLYY